MIGANIARSMGADPVYMFDAAQRLLETMPDGILVVGRDGSIAYANGVAARLSGYPVSELVGRQVDELVPVAQRGQHSQQRDRFARAHQSRPMGTGLDIHLQRADGTLLPVDIALSWMDEEIVVAFRDASVTRTAEREIRRSRERLAAINDVHAALLGGRHLDEVLQTLAERARWIADASLSIVALGDAEAVTVRAASGVEGLDAGTIDGGTLVASVIRIGDVEVIDDAAADDRCGLLRDAFPDVGAVVACPLGLGADAGGALLVGRAGKPFSQDEVAVIVTFAAQAAVVVEYAKLQEDRQLLAVMEERDRIARDLHDGVIQSLFAVGMGLTASKGALDQQMLDRSIDAIDSVIRELRDYIFGLGGARADRSLAALLEDLAREMSVGGVVVETSIDDEVAAAAAGQAGTLLFAAREALSNAMRHSDAKRIELLLSARDGRGVLEVRDDGTGFDTASVSSGFGLHNLSSRAEASGGDLTISSTPGGTTVSLTFPI